jgi:NitT/TauT family transport system ATP-binding protein
MAIVDSAPAVTADGSRRGDQRRPDQRWPDQQPAALVLSSVSKVYGHAGAAVPALDQVSLEVRTGEFVCLVGASGCGKTTLLNLIAGLDHATAGTIERNGETISLMFQEAALFPWLTAARNIELAMQLKKIPRPERRRRVSELLELVHLTGFADKRPHELSGGMRQRVALARCLAQNASVLLMDEPFGALDAITRDLLHDELEKVWQQAGLTVVFVTHNVREAVRLGDRVVMLTSRPGRVAADFPVDAPRPRRIESPEVASVAAGILEQLREEVARHGDR